MIKNIIFKTIIGLISFNTCFIASINAMRREAEHAPASVPAVRFPSVFIGSPPASPLQSPSKAKDAKALFRKKRKNPKQHDNTEIKLPSVINSPKSPTSPNRKKIKQLIIKVSEIRDQATTAIKTPKPELTIDIDTEEEIALPTRREIKRAIFDKDTKKEIKELLSHYLIALKNLEESEIADLVWLMNNLRS